MQRLGACSAPQVVQLKLKLHKIQDPAGTRAQIQQKPPQNPNRQDCGFEEHGQTRERDGLQGLVQSQLKKYSTLHCFLFLCVVEYWPLSKAKYPDLHGYFGQTDDILNSPSSLVTHIEALLSTGIRLQTHKDSSCRYTRPGLQASLYCLQPA